ncbi:MAG TPA: glycosyltransferase family 87 protein [Gemmataceae bacterium]|nr:glycosyltransferase family 87 protein [Gemmataceae bacterium]
MLWHLFALEPERLTPLERTLLRLALVVTVFVLYWTIRDNRVHPGDDLRNRVVGARVMLTGEDPYTFIWQPGMPETLLDPVYDKDAHRLTVSPPTLLLYAPLGPLPWRVIRLVSFVAEWLAMLGSLMLLVRSLPEQRQRVLLLLAAVLFIIATDVWRLHLERGQVYVFQLLALSAAIYWSRRGDVDLLIAGVALGVLGLMRPNLLVIAPALLLTRRWRMSVAMLATVAVGVLATLPALPASSWQAYLAVGDQYYRSIQGSPIVEMQRPQHEGPVEGVEFAGPHSLRNIESSSFAVLWASQHDLGLVRMLNLALVSKAILAILASALLALAWLRRNDSLVASFALIVVLALDTEFFLPHRWGYADVMLLAPLALVLPDLLRVNEEKTPMPVSVPLAIVVLGLISGPLVQQFDLYVATLLRSWLVMFGLTWQVALPHGRGS